MDGRLLTGALSLGSLRSPVSLAEERDLRKRHARSS
jgi:hypothetical protein